jgi:hypothetical protein
MDHATDESANQRQTGEGLNKFIIALERKGADTGKLFMPLFRSSTGILTKREIF